MLISKKLKFIFIHVPKNAGTSIHHALINYSDYGCRYQTSQIPYYLRKFFGNNLPVSLSPFHVTAEQLSQKIGQRWNDYISFAVCRNP